MFSTTHCRIYGSNLFFCRANQETVKIYVVQANKQKGQIFVVPGMKEWKIVSNKS